MRPRRLIRRQWATFGLAGITIFEAGVTFGCAATMIDRRGPACDTMRRSTDGTHMGITMWASRADGGKSLSPIRERKTLTRMGKGFFVGEFGNLRSFGKTRAASPAAN